MSLFPAPQPYERINMLIRLAIWIVILCMTIIVWSDTLTLDDFAKGALSLILGRFLGYVDNIYAYEFGKTRTEAVKDDKITELAKELPTGKMTTDTVNVKAEGDVNVTKETKP